jgi:PhzF family phenazine biosynthesis protein
MEMALVNCFVTEATHSGNPAAVITKFPTDEPSRQALATRLDLPVTVFLDQLASNEYRISYFYPETQMPLCIHGSIAAASLLLKQQAEMNIVTANGQRLTIIKKPNHLFQIKLAAGEVLYHKVPLAETMTMLGLSDPHDFELSLPYVVASIGSPKLLIPLKSFEVFSRLNPNFAEIKAWSIQHQVNGLYVYAQHPEQSQHFYARGFNPKTGYNEDAATGVAAGALLTALPDLAEIQVDQGHFLNRPSRITVSRNKDAIYIGGQVSESINS